MREVQNLKPRTHEFTNGALESLAKYFGDLPLAAITPSDLRGFQVARAANRVRMETGDVSPWRKTAGNSCINHELSVLQQILALGGMWEPLRPWYSPLPVASWSPREVPSIDQEVNLFDAAARHPEAQLALWVATITTNTSASGSELRHMRLRHLVLRNPILARSDVYIPQEGCKNSVRPRKIPLNETARRAFENCYRRALDLGCSDPDDYLFPFRTKRNHFDPKQPASRSWLRKSWGHLRRIVQMPKLCPHDLRLLFVTRSLEAGVMPEIVQALSGHKSRKMMDYYSKFRMEPKLEAVDVIERVHIASKKPPASVQPWPTRNFLDVRNQLQYKNLTAK
jgi:integrase